MTVNKPTLPFCLAMILLCSCAEPAPRAEPELLLVSLIDLLAHPDKHRGRKVQVKGYLLNGYLYLGQDQANVSHDITLSIYVVEPTENGDVIMNCNSAYGSVEGTFTSKGGPDHRRANMIDPVERVTLYTPDPEICWQE